MARCIICFQIADTDALEGLSADGTNLVCRDRTACADRAQHQCYDCKRVAPAGGQYPYRRLRSGLGRARLCPECVA